MKTATGLTLIALGAVLAFAVHGHPWFLNVQVVGWIIMVVGVVGLAVPRRGYGWLRRQVVTRRGPDGRPVVGIRQKRYPPYIMINPAAEGEAEAAVMPEMPTNSEAKSWANSETVVQDPPVSGNTVPGTTVPGRTVVPDEESVEEFFPE